MALFLKRPEAAYDGNQNKILTFKSATERKNTPVIIAGFQIKT